MRDPLLKKLAMTMGAVDEFAAEDGFSLYLSNEDSPPMEKLCRT